MMKVKVQKGWLLLTFLTILSYSSLLAQPNAAEGVKMSVSDVAKEQIKQLHDGVLIVRLPSKHRKIQKLEELAAAPNVSEKSRERLQKQLTETIDDRNRYNIQLTNAFSQYFNFTDVYFMYDTAVVNLKNGDRKGIFIDKNLESVPALALATENYFILRLGTTDAATTTGVEALVVMDKKFDDLKRPFPYYVRTNSITRLFIRIFSPKKATRKDAQKVVKKLNLNLKKYYNTTYAQNIE